MSRYFEEEHKKLNRILGFYKEEGDKCHGAKSYLAACIMYGGCLETALLLMEDIYCDGVKSKTLKQLINIAKKRGWLEHALKLNEDFDRKKAKIGDYAEVMRLVRNCVHPLKTLESGKITKKHSEKVQIVLSYVMEHLYQRVAISLSEDIEKEQGKC